jgi:hypothetical protein
MTASVHVEAGIPDHFLDLIRDVPPDLVLALIDSLPGNFLAPAHVPMNGTKYSVARFRLVPELLDEEVRPAVRALRLQHYIRNDSGHGNQSPVPSGDRR